MGQEQLSRFREEMADKVSSPFTVLIKQKKLPLSLLQEPKGTKRTPVSSSLATRKFCFDVAEDSAVIAAIMLGAWYGIL